MAESNNTLSIDNIALRNQNAHLTAQNKDLQAQLKRALEEKRDQVNNANNQLKALQALQEQQAQAMGALIGQNQLLQTQLMQAKNSGPTIEDVTKLAQALTQPHQQKTYSLQEMRELAGVASMFRGPS